MNTLNSQQIQAASLLANGLSNAQVADQLGVSIRTLQRWVKEKIFLEAVEGCRSNTISRNTPIPSSDIVNVSHFTAKNQISSEIRQFFSFEEHFGRLKQECIHLDLAMQSVLHRIREDGGDLRAIGLLLKISERRCQLLNLNVPKNDFQDSVMNLVQLGVFPSEAVDIIHESFQTVKQRLRDLQPSFDDFLDEE